MSVGDDDCKSYYKFVNNYNAQLAAELKKNKEVSKLQLIQEEEKHTTRVNSQLKGIYNQYKQLKEIQQKEMLQLIREREKAKADMAFRKKQEKEENLKLIKQAEEKEIKKEQKYREFFQNLDIKKQKFSHIFTNCILKDHKSRCNQLLSDKSNDSICGKLYNSEENHLSNYSKRSKEAMKYNLLQLNKSKNTSVGIIEKASKYDPILNPIPGMMQNPYIKKSILRYKQ